MPRRPHLTLAGGASRLTPRIDSLRLALAGGELGLCRGLWIIVCRISETLLEAVLLRKEARRLTNLGS